MKHTPIHKWADTRPDPFECLAETASVDEFDHEAFEADCFKYATDRIRIRRGLPPMYPEAWPYDESECVEDMLGHELAPGAAIAQQYGPLLGKIIMILCALYALELSVMG